MGSKVDGWLTDIEEVGFVAEIASDVSEQEHPAVIERAARELSCSKQHADCLLVVAERLIHPVQRLWITKAGCPDSKKVSLDTIIGIAQLEGERQMQAYWDSIDSGELVDDFDHLFMTRSELANDLQRVLSATLTGGERVGKLMIRRILEKE